MSWRHKEMNARELGSRNQEFECLRINWQSRKCSKLQGRSIRESQNMRLEHVAQVIEACQVGMIVTAKGKVCWEWRSCLLMYFRSNPIMSLSKWAVSVVSCLGNCYLKKGNLLYRIGSLHYEQSEFVMLRQHNHSVHRVNMFCCELPPGVVVRYWCRPASSNSFCSVDKCNRDDRDIPASHSPTVGSLYISYVHRVVYVRNLENPMQRIRSRDFHQFNKSMSAALSLRRGSIDWPSSFWNSKIASSSGWNMTRAMRSNLV